MIWYGQTIGVGLPLGDCHRNQAAIRAPPVISARSCSVCRPGFPAGKNSAPWQGTHDIFAERLWWTVKHEWVYLAIYRRRASRRLYPGTAVSRPC